MKGILQYGPDIGGPFIDFGLIRPHLGKSYQVQSIPKPNRVGTLESSGYSVSIAARALTIRTTFLDFDTYFWILWYPRPGLSILVGEAPYIFNFDALHERNKIFHYDITINLNSINANLSQYIIELTTIP